MPIPPLDRHSFLRHTWAFIISRAFSGHLTPQRTRLGLVTAWADSLTAAAAHHKCTEGASKSVSHNLTCKLQVAERGETFGNVPSRAVPVTSFSHVLASWRERETFFGPFGPTSTKVKRTHSLGDISTAENLFFCWPEAGAVQIYRLHLRMSSARKDQIWYRYLMKNRLPNKRENPYIHTHTHTHNSSIFFVPIDDKHIGWGYNFL